MAKKDQAQVSGDQVAPEQRDAEGNPSAAREGESDLAHVSNEGYSLEEQVNPMTPEEEMERQRAENYPRAAAVQTFEAHEEMEKARAGHAATSRAVVGRVVVVHEDVERDGEVYKAGVQDIPLDVADALVGEGLAFEPAGKKRGR